MSGKAPVLLQANTLLPIGALAVALALMAFPGLAPAVAGLVALAILLGAVFASVHHAEVVALRTGEPYGTLILTVTVTIIEVALIVSLQLSGKDTPTMARDTVFAVIMIVCNGVMGLCILVGGLRHGEPGFSVTGTSAYIAVLAALSTLTLILPNYTSPELGQSYNVRQLVFVSLATLALYVAFLYIQTVRHRDYFIVLDESESDGHGKPTARATAQSGVLLVVALAAIVLLAKGVSGFLDLVITAARAPAAAAGVAVAALILLPETVAALRAAKRNELQKCLNLALGSSLATIGLTIPAVAALSIALKKPLLLGLDAKDSVLLVLTMLIGVVALNSGRTNILYGFVHLVLFATFVFLVFVP